MSSYIETIDEIQKIEEVIIKDSKLKRCCNSSLEIVKTVLKYGKVSSFMMPGRASRGYATEECFPNAAPREK